MNIEKVTNIQCSFDLPIPEDQYGISLSFFSLSFSTGNIFFPNSKIENFEKMDLVVNKVNHRYGLFCCFCYAILFVLTKTYPYLGLAI